MTRKVRKAVFPAAGLGTRFLPATKAIPKEMIPIVDVPMIQHIVEEAVRAIDALSPAGLELVEEPTHGLNAVREVREVRVVRQGL